ncbi:hypothetical protein NIES2119_25995, partial [[Phormidium ambiguum] IAM M-71]
MVQLFFKNVWIIVALPAIISQILLVNFLGRGEGGKREKGKRGKGEKGKREKGKRGKGEKGKGKRNFYLLPSAFCLLPSAFLPFCL